MYQVTFDIIMQSIGLYHYQTTGIQPDFYGITGGTGAYATARGVYISQQLNATAYTSELDIIFWDDHRHELDSALQNKLNSCEIEASDAKSLQALTELA